MALTWRDGVARAKCSAKLLATTKHGPEAAGVRGGPLEGHLPFISSLLTS